MCITLFVLRKTKQTNRVQNCCDTVFESGDQQPKFEGGDLELLKYNIDKIAPILNNYNKRTGNLISNIRYALIISREGKVIGVDFITKMEEELKSN